MAFKFPPKTLFYDNACNTVSTALLRIPWLLLFTLIIVDRFHYMGHKCGAFYDADAYPIMSDCKTNSAEIINAKIKRALFYMRFMKPDVFIVYLTTRFAFLNLISIYMEQTGTTDIEDTDMIKYFNDLISCDCKLCQLRTNVCSQHEEPLATPTATHNN